MLDIEAFFKISYGLYVISAKSGDKINGYIGNTVFQVTADPPQVAISCSKNNFTCDLIKKSQRFSFSILKEDTKAEIIGTFGYKSGKDTNKFKNIKHTTTPSGTPVVTEDCIAWFECKVNNMIDVGTHMLFIALIESNEMLDKENEPLTYAYYHKVKKGMAPRNAPTYIDKSKLKQEPSSKKYRCLTCNYVYDEAKGDIDNGIAPGTSFEDLPDDWICPTCGAPKSNFELM